VGIVEDLMEIWPNEVCNTLALTYVLHLGLRSWGSRVFWSDRCCQDKGPKEKSAGIKMKLGPNDVNLQTKKLHYNYLVLIVSSE